MSVLLILFAAVAVAWILAYHRLPAVVWTVAIAGYLVWAFLARRDERRLLDELDRWEAGTTGR